MKKSPTHRQPLRRSAWLVRPVRVLGLLILAAAPAACAFCVENVVHEKAIQNAGFCAQYVDEGNLTAARARCQIALEYSPKYAEPHNLLGLIEYSLGRQDKAIENFKRAISLRNSFAEAHNNLGGVFMDQGNLGPACDQFLQAIEVDPGYVAARLNLGNCLFHRREFDAARAEYLKCVELDPNSCDCRLGLGSVAVQAKKHDAARTHFQKMTEICPQSPIAFYNLCWADYQLNRCQAAVDACMTVLKIDPKHVEARGTLVQAQECVALGDAAVAEFQQKIRQRPGEPELHFKLGVLLFQKRLLEAALNEFLNTIKIDPSHILAHYWAARAYDDLLRADDTVRTCKKFVDLLRGDAYSTEKSWCIGRVKELQFQ